MSIESSPTIIKYTDGVKVFSSAAAVWKCCGELRSREALVFQSTRLSVGVWWISAENRSVCQKITTLVCVGNPTEWMSPWKKKKKSFLDLGINY